MPKKVGTHACWCRRPHDNPKLGPCALHHNQYYLKALCAARERRPRERDILYLDNESRTLDAATAGTGWASHCAFQAVLVGGHKLLLTTVTIEQEMHQQIHASYQTQRRSVWDYGVVNQPKAWIAEPEQKHTQVTAQSPP